MKTTIDKLALAVKTKGNEITEGEWLECCIVRCTQQTKQRVADRPLCDRHRRMLEEELQRQ